MIDERARRAIESSDTDELLRIVDGMVAARDWAMLLALRLRCQEAVERGKQVWSIDEHIRYRLALDAPAELAGAAVSEGPARFTLGPLPEVAASTHRWEDLEPHLTSGPERAMTAHERVLRGEDVDASQVDPGVLELPLRLCDWEPRYQLANYKGDRAEFPTPPLPTLRPAELEAGEPVADPEATDALAGLAAAWREQSNGRVEAAAVEGTARAAVRAIGPTRVAIAPLSPEAALAWMGWAAASGGAYGRRRGAAAGRFEAWWAAATLAGLEWPPDPGELGEAVSDLRWYAWSDGFVTGWALRLAVEDPDQGLAWALSALDEKT